MTFIKKKSRKSSDWFENSRRGSQAQPTWQTHHAHFFKITKLKLNPRRKCIEHPVRPREDIITARRDYSYETVNASLQDTSVVNFVTVQAKTES